MIEINNLTNFRLDKELFTGIAKKVLKGENRETETLSLAFVSKEEIKKLNKKFRKKNKPTDVLSFGLNQENFLGEIVICPEIVKENSLKYGIDFKKEMMRVFAHGILHLLGHDHPDEVEDPRQRRDEKSKKQADMMEEKEISYLSKI
ncbi:MAG: rRNA maturation RNase YbeY [Candidatus Staskawiczbacteria bacterium RIFCSPHIGHO2_01_FULL_36_16]|uniref:Endoribonuclease YbeY n=1 Tax=Candidatus Staskawiczbacteria bacterium RIFCSPHIGHO2_01_FULL_36_16 TaxID=1802200 RepID=A0A1G2HNJ3_9BACT|nr:MAG: rRNA maturation RNase YbeY [Candidatus Staskawiczbacteria bacterium RIFCSPHIGHO2_01_FULL_36_16]